jgi:hypothetical protein
MTAPWPTIGLGLIPFLLVFGLMLVANVYVILRLLPHRGRPATLADATILIGILLMAVGLWFALIYAILDPGGASEVSVFIALNSMMAVVGCWAIALFLRAETKPLGGPRWQWPVVFATLVIGNELLMGIAFVLAQAGASGYSALGWAGLASLVGDSASSVWFFWAMLANMVFVVYWARIDAPSRSALIAFTLTAAVGPWLVTAPLDGGIAMGVLMAWLLGQMALARRRGPYALTYVRTLGVVWAGFVLMTLGEGAFLLEPDPAFKTLLLALAMFTAMGAELLYLFDHALEIPRRAVDRSAATPSSAPAGASTAKT